MSPTVMDLITALPEDADAVVERADDAELREIFQRVSRRPVPAATDGGQRFHPAVALRHGCGALSPQGPLQHVPADDGRTAGDRLSTAGTDGRVTADRSCATVPFQCRIDAVGTPMKIPSQDGLDPDELIFAVLDQQADADQVRCLDALLRSDDLAVERYIELCRTECELRLLFDGDPRCK